VDRPLSSAPSDGALGLRARGQAGFRKDHRTTDQVFVLRTLIERARTDK